jgi:hypothetical protein
MLTFFGSQNSNYVCVLDRKIPAIFLFYDNFTTVQRCPSRLKSCRCRAVTLEKYSYRAAAVTAYKRILPRRDGFQKNASNFTAATVLDQQYWH